MLVPFVSSIYDANKTGFNFLNTNNKLCRKKAKPSHLKNLSTCKYLTSSFLREIIR